MKVCEIFVSIQGESSHAGLPCTFIRLTGCNLRCSYCDTTYAYAEGEDRTEEEIVGEVAKAGLTLVEITGGEPLLQEGVRQLITRLIDGGHRVLVETNGSRDICGIDSRAVIILDIKTPSSGMSERMRLSNLGCLKPRDEVKFVVGERGDYEWAKKFIELHGLARLECTILLSPVSERLAPARLCEWIIEDRLPVRLNLQMHKYIYGPDLRGV